MPTRTINAIILSRRNWGEADRFVSCFSREFGKVKFVAHGSRKLKSKMAGHIEPFSRGKYFLAKGKRYDVLAGAEAIAVNTIFTKDLELYKDASYICELVDLTQEENHQDKELYKIIKECLETLPKKEGTERKVILRFFEYKLLDHLGYKPNFFVCRKCQKKLVEKENYTGDFEGVFCGNCSTTRGNIKRETLKILRLMDQDSFSNLLKIKGISLFNNDLEKVISPFLNDILPRQLKTKVL